MGTVFNIMLSAFSFFVFGVIFFMVILGALLLIKDLIKLLLKNSNES